MVKRQSKKCPRGYIRRSGYVRSGYKRKSYTRRLRSGKTIKVKSSVIRSRRRIPSKCIRDIGSPGKWKLSKIAAKYRKMSSKRPVGIGPLKKGALGKYGYNTSDSASSRHRALARAVIGSGGLETFRRLNAVMIYTKNTSPVKSQMFKSDRDWVKKTYYGTSQW